MRVPYEILDEILRYLPVNVSIQLRREYSKAQLLKQHLVHNFKDAEHLEWLHKYKVNGQWPEPAYIHFCKLGDFERMLWVEQVDPDYFDHSGVDYDRAISAAITTGANAITEYHCRHNLATIVHFKEAVKARNWPAIRSIMRGLNKSGGRELMSAIERHFWHGPDDMNLFVLQSCPSDFRLPQLLTRTVTMFGSLEDIKYVHDNDMGDFTPECMDQAVVEGRLDIIKFLHENREEGCSEHAIIYAAKHNHMEVVKFLVEERNEDRHEARTAFALEHAVKKGNLEVARYLVENTSAEIEPHVASFAQEEYGLDLLALRNAVVVQHIM